MEYEIEIERKATKAMGRLDRVAQQRVSAAIDNLASDPRPRNAKALTGPYSGHYRIAVTAPGGEYRIVYTVDDKQQRVTVIAAGPRENIY